MINDKKLFNQRLDELENVIVNTNNILTSLMELQISLETNLQSLIKSSEPRKIAISGASKIDFMKLNDIIYCNANLAYTEIISINNKVLSSKSLNEYDKYLSSHSFFRISKSVLINTNHVHSYNKKSGQVVMNNKDILEVARRRKTEFLEEIIP